MTNDEAMRRALKLALNGNGFVSPNPRVGAVILKDGAIISEGWHRQFGEPHAEVEAIRNAGLDSFEGMALVVNLEPCSHYGKTPPCADLIIEKKFYRVIVGMADPNPEVSGRGIQKLKDAGIEVITGVLEEDCRWLNRFFAKNIRKKRPYVIAKIAQTLDGFISKEQGEQTWISSDESRRRAHLLRAECDAVLIGKGTALTDNPGLTVRLVKGRNPRRIVLDSRLSLPVNLDLFTDDIRNLTIVCCLPGYDTSAKAEALRSAGITVQPVQGGKDGRIDLDETLDILSGKYGIASLLVEGGSSVNSAFLERSLIDEMHIFIAPTVYGSGLHAFSKLEEEFKRSAPKFEIKSLFMSGGDIHIISKF